MSKTLCFVWIVKQKTKVIEAGEINSMSSDRIN